MTKDQMIKEPGAFRTIGELSRELNIKQHILRYWEDQFAMLQPLKRAGARRHYRPDDVEMVRTIDRLLNDEGYTIRGARKYLTSGKSLNPSDHLSPGQSSRPTSAIAEAPAAASAIAMPPPAHEDTSLILAELKTVRDRLSRALNEA